MRIRHFVGRLGAALRRYPLRAALLFVMFLVQSLYGVWFPLCFGMLIDRAIRPHDQTALTFLLLLAAGGGVLAVAASVGRDGLCSNLALRLLTDQRRRLFVHLQTLSAGSLANTKAADIQSRFSTDLAAYEKCVSVALPVATAAALRLAGVVIVLFALQWELALIGTVGVGLAFLGPWRLGDRAKAAARRFEDEQAELQGIVLENIAAQPVVKAFGLEERSVRDFDKRQDELFRVGFRAAWLGKVVESLPGQVFLVLNLLVVGGGAVLVFHDRMTVGRLVALEAMLVSFANAVIAISSTIPFVLKGIVGLDRMEEFLNLPAKVTEPAAGVELPRLSQGVEFRSVSFGYHPSRRHLSDVSLHVPHGSTVAVVGGSGSGKSTLVNLLLRFYDPQHGAVLLDGHDLRTVRLRSFRSQVGVVLQDNFLFNTTVRENIQLGRPEASDAEVEAAARAAEVHDFIAALPEGYDTLAGEGGSRFSGGQRQRIAIARALLKDPAILLLDEATSALDPATEAAVNATLKRIARRRTVISITHRLAAVTDADRIVVLDAGRVVEQGRHAELIERGQLYAQLWQKQSGLRLSDDGRQAALTDERLRALPIFQDLDPDLLEGLAREFVTEHYPAGHAVIEEGDVGGRFFVVVRGKLTVLPARAERDSRTILVRRRGETMQGLDAADDTKPANVLQDGDHFGEAALLEESRYACTVRTLTDCVLLTLRRGQFSRLIEGRPALRDVLLRKHGPQGKGKIDAVAPASWTIMLTKSNKPAP